MDANTALTQLGKCGCFHWLIFSMVSFIFLRGVMQMFVIMFMTIDEDHRCKLQSENTSILLNESIPLVSIDGKLTLSSCEMYVEDSWQNSTQSCIYGWTYKTPKDESIISEWDMVCERGYLNSVSSAVFMAGMLVSAVSVTPLSDRFGRKIVLLVCLWIQIPFGISAAFSQSFVVFAALRFIIGGLNQVIGLVSFVYLVEAFTASRRAVVSVAIYMFWALGIMLLAGLAYFVRNWRHLQIAATVPNIVTLLFYFFMPESIPWMFAKNKHTEAKSVIQMAARLNHVTLGDYEADNSSPFVCLETASVDKKTETSTERPLINELNECNSDSRIHTEHDKLASNIHNNISESGFDKNFSNYEPYLTCATDLEQNRKLDALSDVENKENCQAAGNNALTVHSMGRTYTALDLFRTPKMRRYTLILFYLWLATSLGYFGISFIIPSLHGNQYMNVMLGGAVELPAYIICIGALQRWGRRRPQFVSLLLCGISSLAAIFVPITTDAGVNLSWLRITLAMVGKFSITIAYNTIYLYSSEIFPTVVRNQGIGMAALFESIGGILAPFVANSAFPQLPMIIFSVMTAIGGILALFLPESHHHPLPETIEEVECWGTSFVQQPPHTHELLIPHNRESCKDQVCNSSLHREISPETSPAVQSSAL